MKSRTKIALLTLVAIAIVLEIVYSKQKPQEVKQPIATASYLCSEHKSISALYYAGETKPAPSADMPPVPGGSIALTLSDGRTMTLAQTISADGGRYANADESFVFWDKGNGALVLENNQEKSCIGCIVVALLPEGSNLTQTYANSGDGFSIRLPEGYITDESYVYQNLGPTKDIKGIKFTIAPSVAMGTNLGSDTYVSVEEIPQTVNCSAALFLDHATATSMTENNMTYSVASSTGAGAGNRYEETVYALPSTNPCIAVRYFVHYGVFENYPAGTVREFDKQALLSEFDAIRRTLITAP